MLEFALLEEIVLVLPEQDSDFEKVSVYLHVYAFCMSVYIPIIAHRFQTNIVE